MKRLYVGLVSAAVLAAVMIPTPARGCSCALGDPRDALAEADAAIVGEFLAAGPGDGSGGGSAEDTIYTFRVIDEYKADFGETLDIHSPASGISCGLEVGVGEQTGLFLYHDPEKDQWVSNLCSQIPSDDLREAAAPLPEPDGTGPIAMLVGGSVGDTRVWALDSQGRTLGYGAGDGDVLYISVCPGSERIAEIVDRFPEASSIAVRDLSSLEVLSEAALPMRPRRHSIVGVYCANQSAGEIFVLLSDRGEPVAEAKMVRVSGENFSTVYRGSAQAGTFHDRRAYLSDGRWGRRINRLNLDTGNLRRIARLGGGAYSVAVGPNEDRLAAVTYGRYDTGGYNKDLAVIDLDSEGFPVTSRRIDRDPDRIWDAIWMNADDVVVAGPNGRGGGRVYDTDLRELGRFGWSTRTPIIIDGALWGVGWGILQTGALPDGPQSHVREFPSPVTYALVAVPDEVFLEGP